MAQFLQEPAIQRDIEYLTTQSKEVETVETRK